MKSPLTLFLSAHGLVDHLYGFLLEWRLIGSVDDLLGPSVILVRLAAHLKGLLNVLEVLHGSGGRVNKVFGWDLEAVITEINSAIAA